LQLLQVKLKFARSLLPLRARTQDSGFRMQDAGPPGLPLQHLVYEKGFLSSGSRNVAMHMESLLASLLWLSVAEKNLIRMQAAWLCFLLTPSFFLQICLGTSF